MTSAPRPQGKPLPDVCSLRRYTVEKVGVRTRHGRLMHLVNQVLNPAKPESAAKALTRLLVLLCDLEDQGVRTQAKLFCLLQSSLYFSDSPDVLLSNLTTINERRAGKKKKGRKPVRKKH